jgi:hypothetical protein
MLKYFITLFISLFSAVTLAQEKVCDCRLLVDPDYTGGIRLYNNPDGKILRILKNDSVNDDCMMLSVDKDTENYFHATIRYAMANKLFKGRLKKEPYIGTYVRNYDNSPLLFFSETGTHSKVRSKLSEHTSQLLTVQKCHAKWVYAKLLLNKKEFEGWVAPEMQCPNPFTICN